MYRKIELGENENKMELAVTTFLESRNVEDAARELGVSKTTFWRWQQTEEFQRLLRRARLEILEQSITRLQQASSMAVETLVGVMVDTRNAPSARVNAARAVLDFAMKGMKVIDNHTNEAEGIVLDAEVVENEE
jgi:hypothetical protein